VPNDARSLGCEVRAFCRTNAGLASAHESVSRTQNVHDLSVRTQNVHD
jgi:hypothetical protein